MTGTDQEAKCSIIARDGVVTVKGPCADSIAAQHGFFQALSKALGKEISFQQCIDPSTGRIQRLVIDTLGDATSTELKNQRVCGSNELQISVHTHPTSGRHEFSETDTETVTARLRREIDNCGCVVGRYSSRCWCGLLLPHSHSKSNEPSETLTPPDATSKT
jgi:hypothetical protein